MAKERIYSVDVMICATAYVRATSKRAAKRVAQCLGDCSLELYPQDGYDVDISDRDFDDPALPDVSLSPAMTIHGPPRGAVVECVSD